MSDWNNMSPDERTQAMASGLKPRNDDWIYKGLRWIDENVADPVVNWLTKPRGSGAGDAPADLGEAAGEFRERYQETIPIGEGDPMEGRSGDFGIDERDMGTPRVAPQEEPEITPASGIVGEAPQTRAADVDYIFAGGPNDRYSRMRSALSDLIGETVTDSELGQILTRGYTDVTGEMAPWESAYEATQMIDPATFEAILMGL